MADFLDSAARSQLMSKVKNTNTGPELRVRSALFRAGFRFRKNVRSLPGCPDIVLPRYRQVVFVNGCFWHGHDCPRGKLPASNTQMWREKIERNVARDERAVEALHYLGWDVTVIWTCQLKTEVLRLLERLAALKAAR